MNEVTRSVSRAIASSGTTMRTFNSFVKIQREHEAETLALKIRSVRRERRASVIEARPIEQAQPRPKISRRNSINGVVDAAVPVDPNFIALLQQPAIRNGQFLNELFESFFLCFISSFHFMSDISFRRRSTRRSPSGNPVSK